MLNDSAKNTNCCSFVHGYVLITISITVLELQIFLESIRITILLVLQVL